MIPATVAASHSISTLDRIAFCKSVREKRKQLQLNLHGNGKWHKPYPFLPPLSLCSTRLIISVLFNLGKDNLNSSTENAFLTQMLQSSTSSLGNSSASGPSSLDISSLLRKSHCLTAPSSAAPPPSHRSVTGTLTNILPALLNGTMPSPRGTSPIGVSMNIAALNSPTSTNTTDTLVETKCSASLPVSPATHKLDANMSHVAQDKSATPTSSSPPRCRSYPMAALTKRSTPPTPTASPPQSTQTAPLLASPTSYLLATASSCPSLMTAATAHSVFSSTSPTPDDTAPKIVRSASVKSCASDSGVSSSSPLSDNNIVHVSDLLVGKRAVWSLTEMVFLGVPHESDWIEPSANHLHRQSKT